MQRRGGGSTAVAEAAGGAVRRLVLRGPHPAGSHLPALYLSSPSSSSGATELVVVKPPRSLLNQPQGRRVLASSSRSPPSSSNHHHRKRRNSKPIPRRGLRSKTPRGSGAWKLRVPGPPPSQRGERVDKWSEHPAMRAV